MKAFIMAPVLLRISIFIVINYFSILDSSESHSIRRQRRVRKADSPRMSSRIRNRISRAMNITLPPRSCFNMINRRTLNISDQSETQIIPVQTTLLERLEPHLSPIEGYVHFVVCFQHNCLMILHAF